jgi:hypothetical protein
MEHGPALLASKVGLWRRTTIALLPFLLSMSLLGKKRVCSARIRMQQRQTGDQEIQPVVRKPFGTTQRRCH